jgi:hypothetical protein
MSFLAGIAERALGLARAVQPVVGSRFAFRPPVAPEVSPEEITPRMDAGAAVAPEAPAPVGGPRPVPDPASSEQPVSRPGSRRQPLQGRPGTVVGTVPAAPQPEGAAPARASLHAAGPVRHRQDSTILTPSSEPLLADTVARLPAESPAQPPDTHAGSVRAQPLPSSSRRAGGRASQDAGQPPTPSPPDTAEPRFMPLLPADVSRPPRLARVDATRAERRVGSAPRPDGEGASDLPPSPEPSADAPPAGALLAAAPARPPVNGLLYESPALSQPPVVRVTIGRIEVRAVMQAPPSAKRDSPPSPSLTLDDYLKRHNGGGR